MVCYFDSSERRWEKISDDPNILSRFWFHNKYYSGIDSVLYVFGGYSQHKYYNLVQQYSFKNKEWDSVQTSGDTFHPRQHAAIGNYEDTIYILGGYGSKSGDQILNPQHYKDLMAFSLKDKKFIKKYEFQSPLEDIDFAHSMVLDMDDRSYYVLASTIFEYETNLQLLKGSLADPNLIMLGDQIPFKFHNENSFSDLYLAESSQKLIAATYLTNPEDNKTDFSIYTISFPPHITETENLAADDNSMKMIWRIIFSTFVLSMIALLIWYYRKKETPLTSPEPETSQSAGKHFNESGSTQPFQNSIPSEKAIKPANSILFFGGFQIINRNGEDITKKFTPLLKELFLLIFLHSVKDKGISVQNLTEILWFSMDAKNAKNNRAVNIAKLKNLIPEIEGCHLSRKTGYWQIIFDDSIVYNDYWSAFKMLNDQNSLSQEELHQLLCITRVGPLLGSANYEWLDDFKSDCSNQIIDTLIQYTDQATTESNHELMISLADTILIFDMLHEEAISIKCKALTALGKHSLAKDIFSKFSKDFKTLYDEPYEKSFTDIIKE